MKSARLSSCVLVLAILGCTEEGARILSFEAAPATVALGERTELSWRVEGADSIRLSAEPGGALIDGSTELAARFISEPLGHPTTFTLTAEGDGTVTRESRAVSIEGMARPSILSFRASPPVVEAGDTAILSFEVRDTERIEIVELETDRSIAVLDPAPLFGRTPIEPEGSRTYRLSAEKDGETATATASVTLSGELPSIRFFRADSTVVIAGRPIRLSWATIGADQVELLREGDPAPLVATSTAFEISLVQTEPRASYRLTAANRIGSVTSTVEVEAHPPPSIETFEAGPSPVAAGEPIRIGWSVRDMTRLRLLADGAPVPEFAPLDSETLVDSSGAIDVRLSEDAVLELTAETIAGVRSRSIEAQIAARHPGDGVVWLDHAEVPRRFTWYAVEVPPGGELEASTGDVLGCTLDTVLRVLAPDRTFVAEDDEGRPEGCSAVDLFHLPGGTYFVGVTGYAGTLGRFSIAITARPGGCGNGDVGPGETCDDGNLLGNDGCSATCSRELLAENEALGNDVSSGAGVLSAAHGITFAGSIDPAGDVDWYAIEVPEGHHLEALLTVDSATACPARPLPEVALLEPDGVTARVLGEGLGKDGCSGVDPIEQPRASALPAGRYFLRVAEPAAPIASYQLQVVLHAAACGNGILDPAERCDDGNPRAGDGCAACAHEIEPVVLQGPTDSTPVSLPLLGGYRLIELEIVEPGSTLTATAADPGLATCLTVDTGMRLLDASFAELRRTTFFDDRHLLGDLSDPHGRYQLACATLTARDLEPGTYYLQIDNQGPSVGDVEVGITVRPPPFRCGNGIIEGGEECDHPDPLLCSACQRVDPTGGTIVLTSTAPLVSVPMSSGDIESYLIDLRFDACLAVTSDAWLESLGTLYDQHHRSLIEELPGPFPLEPPPNVPFIWEVGSAVICGAGRYHLVLEAFTTLTWEARAITPICQNGTLEPRELCDDPSILGCSSACLADQEELEPNDSRASADPLLFDPSHRASAHGHFPFLGTRRSNVFFPSAEYPPPRRAAPDRADYRRVVIPEGPPRSLSARIYRDHAEPLSCVLLVPGNAAREGYGGKLSLLDAFGAELANGDRGSDNCSSLDHVGPLAPGTYYLRIGPANRDAPYWLAVELF